MPSGTPGSLPRRSTKTRSVCFARVPLGIRSNARMCPRRVSLMYSTDSSGEKARPLGRIKSPITRLIVTRPGVTRYTPEKGQVPLLGGGGTAPRVGEVDAAVGLDHDVVGPVELPPPKAVRDHGDAAVNVLP